MNEQDVAANIRKLRRRAQLTLSDVARRADITKSTLSKIENAQTSPPISTLIRIAKALDRPVADFFVQCDSPPVYVYTPRGRGEPVTRNGSQFGYSYEALALGKTDKSVEPFLLTIRPGDPPGQFQHGGQEFIYILSGRLEFTVGADTLLLKTGDSLYFNSDLPHCTRVLGGRPVKFLCVFVQDIALATRKET